MPAPTNDKPLTLPNVVYSFKSWTTKLYSDGVKKHGWLPFSRKLWQGNYYEHVIRDDDELMRIREYIINNPLNWDEDEENPINVKNQKPTKDSTGNFFRWRSKIFG